MAYDRELLANDLAALLSERHGIDVDTNDVKRGIDGFLEKIRPTTPAEAAARVSAFLGAHTEFRGHRTDEFREQVARIDEHVLNASDLRVLVAAATGERRSIREKLVERGSLPRRVDCPFCTATPTANHGVISAHNSPETNRACRGAGAAVPGE